jgi:hypothetical protein
MKIVNKFTFGGYMKLAVILFLLSTTLYAYPVPKELVDAEITVKTRDGLVYKFSANHYKVVKRGAVKSPTLVPVPLPIIVKIKESTPKKLNRFSLMAGIGPSQLLKVTNGDTYKRFAVKRELLIGLSYGRLLTDELSVGATIISNESVLLNAGFDF